MNALLDSYPPQSIPPEDEALRRPVRVFLEQTVGTLPPVARSRSWSGFDADFSRELARRGWVGLTLPERYGGANRSPFARFVLVEELLNWGAPVAAHWIADRQSAPLILHYGNEAQRQFYLPRICRGEAFFCIGMSEPNSGSDLASVRTRAARAGDRWILNGQKVWTTHAHRSHYMLALVRTSGDADGRHQGLSQFIVDLSLPGTTVRPIEDLNGDAHFCEVFFEDVALDTDALIGEEGRGWDQVTAELAFERSGPERIYSSAVLFDQWVSHLRERDSAADPRAAQEAGRIVSQLAVLREMSLSVAGLLAQGRSPAVEAAIVKDLGTQLEQSIPSTVAALLGAEPAVSVPPALQHTLAHALNIAPSFSLRGGTREILRGMIARGLGLR